MAWQRGRQPEQSRHNGVHKGCGEFPVGVQRRTRGRGRGTGLDLRHAWADGQFQGCKAVQTAVVVYSGTVSFASSRYALQQGSLRGLRSSSRGD